MLGLQTVENQLKQADCSIRVWGRAEVRELSNILLQDEVIAQCTNGYYDGGFAMLCVTNHRVLLVDRKPMFLTIEDIRFDMISEVDYFFGMLSATIRILTPNQTLRFTSWGQGRLRKIATYTQQRVIEIRTSQMPQQMRQFQQQVQTQAPYQLDDSMWASKKRRTVPVRRIASLAMRAQQKLTNVQAAPQFAQDTGPFNISTKLPTNPYNKVPILSRRRQYPPFH